MSPYGNPAWVRSEQTLNAKFWTGSEYRSSGYHGDTDDRANALAVVAGLADTNNYEHLRKVFAKHFNASPYMEKYVLEALYQMHAPDQAIQRMKQRWASQIDSPLTTLWEGWGIGTNGYGGGTYNHAWSGGALTALSQYAAGVGPDTPAFDSYHVVPQMGALTSVHSVVPTPKGEIRVDLRKEAGVFDLRLTSPASTSALVGIPTEAEHSIGRVELNGKNGLDTWRYPDVQRLLSLGRRKGSPRLCRSARQMAFQSLHEINLVAPRLFVFFWRVGVGREPVIDLGAFH